MIMKIKNIIHTLINTHTDFWIHKGVFLIIISEYSSSYDITNFYILCFMA